MSQQQILVERFIETLICGDRPGARGVLEECLMADIEAERIIELLFWPALDQIERLFRQDQISVMRHQMGTRILRMLADQMQMRLPVQEDQGRELLMVCGANEPNELAGQMAADMIEAAGFDITFCGGGIANDEIISAVGERRPDALVLFSSAPSDLPHIRALIDDIRDSGCHPNLQIVVGGGVFNRAEGLAQEIGADLWATSPADLVQQVTQNAERRMPKDQRTVGRRRRQSKAA